MLLWRDRLPASNREESDDVNRVADVKGGPFKLARPAIRYMDPAVLRDDMVDGLTYEAKDVLASESVALAMRTVPREPFVENEAAAYADRPHHVAGSTVFAPRTVARLLGALEPTPGDNCLVVGAGVGYTVALIADLVGSTNVQAIELSQRLVRIARTNLAETGHDGVLVEHGDGARGLSQYAPYDRVLVEPAAVEPPRALIEQLAPDGRLVMPRGLGVQELVTFDGDGMVRDRHGSLAVEPLLVRGEEPGALERNRTAREDREHAARSAARRSGWERNWIDWDDGGSSITRQ